MPNSDVEPFERRQHARVPASGSIVFRCHGQRVHGRLRTISEVAVEVACPLGFTSLGEPIEFGLRFDGPAGGWLVVRGRITHVRAASRTIVIALSQPEPEIAARIADWQRDLRGGPAPHQVIVADNDRERRTLTAAAFRERGCDVVEAATPLEVLYHLGNGRSHSDVIAVAGTTPPSTGDELRQYLALSQPGSLVVRVSDESLDALATAAPWQIAHGLRVRIAACLAALDERGP